MGEATFEKVRLPQAPSTKTLVQSIFNALWEKSPK